MSGGQSPAGAAKRPTLAAKTRQSVFFSAQESVFPVDGKGSKDAAAEPVHAGALALRSACGR